MTRLEEAPEVHDIARTLQLSPEGNAVSNILRHCHSRIDSWLTESFPIRSIKDLEILICSKLKLMIREVESDTDLALVCQHYVKQGEVVFAAVHDDFDDETFATLVERKQASRTALDKYVAVVDCRGEKGSRRFFTRWHEIAHILTLNQQLELRLHRSRNEQSPSERLMDTIAAEVGFYPPLFDPILQKELTTSGRLTFAGVERIRAEFCPEASFAATLNTCIKRCGHAVALLECGMSLKKKEADQLRSGQSLLLPEESPVAKLRVTSVHSNAAAKGHMIFHRNIAVPISSIIFNHHSHPEMETIDGGVENLKIWKHSDGSCLGDVNVHMEVRKIRGKIQVLVTDEDFRPSQP